MGRPKQIKVRCIKGYSDYLNKDFVEANKKRLSGREHGSGYYWFVEGEVYEAHKWSKSYGGRIQRYVMSDLLFPEDHRVVRESGKKKIRVWQSFYREEGYDGFQNFDKYFEELPGE